MKVNRSISRRQFLRGAAAGVMIVPAYVVGRGAELPPSERIRVAAIGAGGKGQSDVAEVSKGAEIVALCDVDLARAGASLKAHPNARQFTDFRKMFDAMEKSIDAVTISTPDHTHYAAAIWAIRRGKHVLVQKPLTHSMWEARELALAARKHKVVSKMGNQGQATEETRRLIEMVRAGAIGTVREIHIWTDRAGTPKRFWWPQGGTRPAGEDAVPAGLDWDAWLGPAPARPYLDTYKDGPFKGKKVYHPFVWRGWKDFGSGALGDIACHSTNAIFWALEEMRGPFSVEAETSPCTDEMYPEWSIITYRFRRPNGAPDPKFVWYDGGRMPPRPAELEPERAWDADNGALYVGDKGSMLGTRLFPEAKMKEYAPHAPPPTLPRSPGHTEEWLAAIRGAPRVDNSFDHAGPLTEMVLAGNVALRAKAKLDWDPAAFKFTNHRDANRWVKRDYRAGWEL
ncbi:MAG: Gfo/Idh/MocA family oxidoreductase [Verrucomicrobia bacterium]|nr:Gfo/Idh/MocA family oxidoreductase [Verrucomicrobiota bacterium]